MLHKVLVDGEKNFCLILRPVFYFLLLHNLFIVVIFKTYIHCPFCFCTYHRHIHTTPLSK